MGVSAAVDPATGNLYVLGSFWSSAPIVPSFSLVLFSGGTSSLIGTYTAPFEPIANPSFNSAAGMNVGTLAVNPSTGDVMAFMLVRSVSLNKVKLYAMPVTNFGSPITQSADIVGTAGSLAGTKILFNEPVGCVRLLLGRQLSLGDAAQLSGRAGPGDRAPERLEYVDRRDGALERRHRLRRRHAHGDSPPSPRRTPSSRFMAWNLDLDYHSSTETGADRTTCSS